MARATPCPVMPLLHIDIAPACAAEPHPLCIIKAEVFVQLDGETGNRN